ncbi:ABC transporter permease [Bacillus benzoevorans]|uniref:Peptide/nickel transport system permease protein n=1 Tax=Bacillus benzoevorans TaxID=1456 RepID=A0A7X0HV80_9BACI|nr:ABC transporter permease [Bacillus benzoevorans]MBB6446181.1 peptide/nickel transport system permease protein [Bacillus benzoevorans]
MAKKWKQSYKAFMNDKIAVAGAAIIGLAIITAVFAPWIASYDPNTVAEGSSRLMAPGSGGHILGTDQQGRDILSRLIFGTQTSLISAVVPVIIAAVISVILGVAAGYYQGFAGSLIMRLMDVFFAFPAVLLAIAIAAILGPGLLNVIIAMIIVRIPYMTRVVYTDTLQESQKEYVEAAKAFGHGNFEIMFKQILPNVLPSLIAYSTTLAGVTIVTVAGLSFIGLGVQPPTADWGRMASDGSKVLMQGHAYVTFIPGIAILILSFAFSMIGDGLRNAMDPYERSKVKEKKKVKRAAAEHIA